MVMDHVAVVAISRSRHSGSRHRPEFRSRARACEASVCGSLRICRIWHSTYSGALRRTSLRWSSSRCTARRPPQARRLQRFPTMPNAKFGRPAAIHGQTLRKRGPAIETRDGDGFPNDEIARWRRPRHDPWASFNYSVWNYSVRSCSVRGHSDIDDRLGHAPRHLSIRIRVTEPSRSRPRRRAAGDRSRRAAIGLNRIVQQP